MGEARRKRESADFVMPSGQCINFNRPTPQSRKVGEFLRLFLLQGSPSPRAAEQLATCDMCPFKLGPEAGHSAALEAMSCVIERIPYKCSDDRLCAAYERAAHCATAANLRMITGGKTPFQLPPSIMIKRARSLVGI